MREAIDRRAQGKFVTEGAEARDRSYGDVGEIGVMAEWLARRATARLHGN